TRTCSSTSRRSSVRDYRPSMKIRSWNMTSWKTAVRAPRKTSRSPKLTDRLKLDAMISPPATPGVFNSGGKRRGQEIARTRTRLGLADAALQPHRAGREQPQRVGIDAVLHFENPLRQRLSGVVIADADRALHQDRARIGFRNHEMHGRARNL